jgi:hypothetical protein
MSAHDGPLAAMQEDPLQGDIRKLQGLPARISRRILFEVVIERRHAVIAAIERRTSSAC